MNKLLPQDARDSIKNFELDDEGELSKKEPTLIN
jgi:hypothetical protein